VSVGCTVSSSASCSLCPVAGRDMPVCLRVRLHSFIATVPYKSPRFVISTDSGIQRKIANTFNGFTDVTLESQTVWAYIL
jgi:hypothetical protein